MDVDHDEAAENEEQVDTFVALDENTQIGCRKAAGDVDRRCVIKDDEEGGDAAKRLNRTQLLQDNTFRVEAATATLRSDPEPRFG